MRHGVKFANSDFCEHYYRFCEVCITQALKYLISDMKSCRLCVTNPLKQGLPHEPRPVFQVSSKAKIAICGQAPGTKVHVSGRPFTDASGDRLREWMGIDEGLFYNPKSIAIIPMGFCFPGQTEKGADLPPRKECAAAWHNRLFSLLPQLELILLVGKYSLGFHLKGHDALGRFAKAPLYETVENYKEFLKLDSNPSYLPLPHPSWRNNHWLKKNIWFEQDYLPVLRREISKRL